MDAGAGIEPTAPRYERDELPLLYPAIKLCPACPVSSRCDLSSALTRYDYPGLSRFYNSDLRAAAQLRRDGKPYGRTMLKPCLYSHSRVKLRCQKTKKWC